MPPKSKVKISAKKRIVIGIGGSGPGAGKDTAAIMISDWLDKHTALKTYTTHFAQRLKWILQDEFGFTPEQLHGKEKEIIDLRYGKTPRDVMKLVANWFKNDVDKDWWIKQTDRMVQASTADVIIIPDVRFENEIEYITSFDDHLLIYIERPPNQLPLQFNEVINHAMNANHPSVDLVIDNNGTYDTLRSLVETFAFSHFADDVKS